MWHRIRLLFSIILFIMNLTGKAKARFYKEDVIMLVSAKEMLVKAIEGHYAVGHFNINNLEWTKAILEPPRRTIPR